MLEFKEYQSKPITRKAHQITQEDIDTATEMPIYRGRPSNRHIKIKGKMISRIPLQAVRVGDYIVRDGYDFHICAKDVFEAGNIIPTDNDFPPYQQRVIDEKAALDEKLEKLGMFIDFDATFKKLDHAEQQDLRTQVGIMKAYSNILRDRISRF